MIRTVWIGAAALVLVIFIAGCIGAIAVMQGPRHPPPPVTGYGPPPNEPAGPPPNRPTELVAVIVVTFVLGGGTLLGAWFVLSTLSRGALAPLDQTTIALETLAGGDFSKRVITSDGDERVRRLALAYNRAAETVARVFEERRHAARESQRFLADAGHELRTPLTIVSGYLDILASGDGMDAATFARVTNNMRTETARMRTLVEKMLLLARIESAPDRGDDVRLDEAVRDVVQAAIARYPGRTIRVSGSVERAVYADSGDVAEALGNVVENALKYAPQSDVEIRLYEDAAHISIDVTDRGPGIMKADRAFIFERFYRGEGRGTTDGVGLGLAIARSAAERWHGDVTLASDVSATTFTLRFPKERRT